MQGTQLFKGYKGKELRLSCIDLFHLTCYVDGSYAVHADI
jgi:hypothetical protein